MRTFERRAITVQVERVEIAPLALWSEFSHAWDTLFTLFAELSLRPKGVFGFYLYLYLYSKDRW